MRKMPIELDETDVLEVVSLLREMSNRMRAQHDMLAEIIEKLQASDEEGGAHERIE